MRKIGSILSMALLVLISSCEKNDAKPEQSGTRVTKVEYSSDEYTSFVYNPDHTISKMVFAEAGEISNSNFTYANGSLSEIHSEDGLTYQLKYNNGKPYVVDVLEDGTGKISFNELVYYSASGYLQQVTTYSMTTNPAIFPPFFRIVYDYYNDNTGNVKAARYYFYDENVSDFVLTKTIEYSQYDSKVNPFAQFGLVGYLLFGVNAGNNPGKMVEKDEDGQVTSTSIFNYTYNSKGLPTQAVETVTENGTTKTNTVKFSY
ncbi:MAG TPA: hypothetical protein VK166_17765 [Chitinophagaceae bacterium]|nr:hypothetical protein [Chitinophagaceae bacterium]